MKQPQKQPKKIVRWIIGYPSSLYRDGWCTAHYPDRQRARDEAHYLRDTGRTVIGPVRVEIPIPAEKGKSRG